MANASMLTAKFPIYHMREQTKLALILWPVFSLFTFALTFVVWLWQGEIRVSGWDQATQIIRWYPFVMGIYLGWDVLELHVANGQTRRNFAVQMATLTAGFSALVAAMITVTFGVEAGIYALAGWPQELRPVQFFTSVSQVHLVFIQNWLIMALWMIGGLFIASAWYRGAYLGAGAILIAILVAGVSSLGVSGQWEPFGWVYSQISGQEAIPVWLGAVLHLLGIGFLMALTRHMILRADLRPKSG